MHHTLVRMQCCIFGYENFVRLEKYSKHHILLHASEIPKEPNLRMKQRSYAIQCEKTI